MAIEGRIPKIERSVFFTGQQLTAADLTAVQASQRELRWLHNRSLHNWGIAEGLGVTGERDDTIVAVEQGFGLDCLGREIILHEPVDLTVPAVGGGERGEAVFYLAASYLADREQQVAENRPGVCLPPGTVRLTNDAQLEWKTPDRLREGLDLVLAQAWVLNCRLSRRLSLAPRRSARPDLQQYIFAGQSAVGKTTWSLWQPGNNIVGVMTEVNTAEARFQTTPFYQAHIVGDRLVTLAGNLFLLTSIPSLVEPTPNSFTMRALLHGSSLSDGVNPSPAALLDQGNNLLQALDWHVVWMGIEA